MNGSTPTRTTPAAGARATVEAREPIDRDALPPGSGEIDPPEAEDLEETLEAFRQLGGSAEDAAPAPAADAAAGGNDPGDEDDYQADPGDEGFAFPGSEQPVEGQEQEPVVAQQPTVEPAQQPEPVVAQPAAGTQPAAAPAVAQAAPEQPVTFQSLSEGLEQNLSVIRDKLASDVYTVSDKQLEELATDPKKVYSQMMANVHMNAVSSVMRVVASNLPNVVMGMMKAQQRNAEAENRFWKQFPGLDRTNPQHRSTVATVAQNVRAMNPQMAEADMVRFTAAQAAVMLGVAGVPVQPQPNARPRAPQMPGRQVRQTPQAYSAAGSKQPGARAAPAPARNQWDLMTSLIQMGDQGRFDPPT
jgi:hypothetical protein